MRISDWSSDVCSSDLGGLDVPPPVAPGQRPRHPLCHRTGRAALSDAERRLSGDPGHRQRTAGAVRQPGAQAHLATGQGGLQRARSEEHTSELQSLMRISYAVFCLKKKKVIMNIKNN